MTSRRRLWLIVACICVGGGVVFLALLKDRATSVTSQPKAVTSDKVTSGEPTAPITRASRENGLFGQVVDAEGRGVAGATVEVGVFEGKSLVSLARRVLVHSTRTESSGDFSFAAEDLDSLVRGEETLKTKDELSEWLPEGLQSLLVASKGGYCVARRPVSFDGVQGPLRIVLEKNPEVNGKVIWKHTGQPVARVKVICELDEEDLYQASQVEGSTDDVGHFTMMIPAQGMASIWPDFEPHYHEHIAQSRITLVPGVSIAGLVLEVELRSSTLIEGRVVDGEGNPVVGAEARLSTRKRVSAPVTCQQDGKYRLLVPKDWPYQCYYIGNWPGKPRIRGSYVSGDLRVQPVGEYRLSLSKYTWEWGALWTPPADAPAERLVAVHPDYETGVVEVPRLGIGQIRKDVDIILQTGTRVSGRVVDDSDQPLKGAVIEIKVIPTEEGIFIDNDNEFVPWATDITSAADGTFEIRFLREGTYDLTASCEHCDTLTKWLELQPHEVVEGFDFELARRKGFIRGKVLDSLGNPWPHGEVKADTRDWFGFGLTEYRAKVEPDGRYELSRIKPGKYNVWLEVFVDYTKPEGVLWASPLQDVPTGTEDADIVVAEIPAGALRVRVVDRMQQPIKKFRILCCPLRLEYGMSAIRSRPDLPKGGGEIRPVYPTDSYTQDARYSGVLVCRQDVVSEGGEFKVERVAPGTYLVVMKSEEHGEKSNEAKIVGGDETQLLFELESLGRVQGVVLDEGGVPLQGIEVRAMKMTDVLCATDWVKVRTEDMTWEAIHAHPRTKSGEDGQFVLDKLEQTEYRITAENEEGRSVTADVSVSGSNEAFLELVFPRGQSSIEGFVYGEDGGSPSGAEVLAEGPNLKSRTRTNDDGHYIFPDLPPGSYLIKAEIGGRGSRRYQGQAVELAQGQQAHMDIIASWDGVVRGTCSLTGDAARAAAWYIFEPEMRLVMREVTDSGGREIIVPIGDVFECRSIPPGRYEAWAYCVVGTSPEPIPFPTQVGSIAIMSHYIKFTSECEIVRMVPGSGSSLHFTISQAVVPHWPIADAATCERRAGIWKK